MSLVAATALGILTVLKRHRTTLLLDELADVGGDAEVLERLLTRLQRAAAQGVELSYAYTVLLSWLVARVGPQLSMPCEMIEAEVAYHAKGARGIVMPRWALAVPVDAALQRRVPCTPFVDGGNEELLLAYRGLVEHLDLLATLPQGQQQSELLNAAIPWRVVALADRLEPEMPRADGRPDPIATRLERLKSRTVGGSRASTLERGWWRPIDSGLCSRRHALSHLGDAADGWTFTRCVESMWTLDEARTATAGIALAVLDCVARALRDASPSRQMLDEVLNDRSTAWLDEHGDE
jgi:hypothetical protein